MVGLNLAQSLVQRGVAAGRDQRLLQPVALRGVVVDVVRGDHKAPGLAGQRDQRAVALGVAAQEVLLQLDVDRVRAVPVAVLPQQVASFHPLAGQRQPREGAVPAAGEQHQPFGVLGEMRRIKPRLPPIHRVGQREQPRQIRVAVARLDQQRHPRLIRQRDLTARDRLNLQTVRQPRKLQGAAEVGVGLGQGGHTQRPRSGQQVRARARRPGRRSGSSWRAVRRSSSRRRSKILRPSAGTTAGLPRPGRA